MALESIAVTGGTGQLGPTVVAHLRTNGYTVTNLSRHSKSALADHDYRVSALDSGDLTATLSAVDADAIVHLGTISTPDHDPGHRVFESNVQSTYVVLEAAAALDIDNVAIASSMSAIGGSFEPDPARIDYLPIDEGHRETPSNPYGLGKYIAEQTATGFSRRDDAPKTIASLRFPWMPSKEEARQTFAERDRSLSGLKEAGFFHTARNTLFSYLGREDAARLVRRALEANYEGHEEFWAAAADTSTTVESATLARDVYPDADVRDQLSGHQSLVSTEKAKQLLGWVPEWSWRDGQRGE
ncbi:NAD(P)-dependent oxidoreductase [Haloferax mediterranei ATCC 33500]|uniref:NAD(P)-dependent oxidoreductase n=1 Tax=Haloferax mediterranei (strain ATCC 33500 / DSM 1411 / JCM 8866 / NBRC 14739 / NCIMB 2177 / R-4) TaxID=523841 RepID=I3R1E2_HALMT|nr:NAD(P)-dependent oxidoreductase [Haloferax mediterranei]AFK18052.1 UDP-glucose 4-epimerase [Haloferax mediterranei ATCC 33500]AHZ22535.1 UDP-glucose 4-epimerase [Haloferax mediterranei ATCC 33500]EMA02672.1 UDP-glucose 4-epimerase [Haloferax mediterranei ATCC 33500]MDX5988145.1 NAD(P)-dependent oxidoreductase [Haloferax mediterranei ATCC 33500]QCQ74592.1 NAD(P)-dependent oxidoreductase [Haloferax mediterranei ATCC 33500]